MLFTELG